MDGRRREARRWRTLYADYRAALRATPTPGQDALLRRTASLAVAAEQVDADLTAGRAIDHDNLVRLTNALGRCLASLGLVAWADAMPATEVPPKPDPDAALARLRNWHTDLAR